MLTRLDKFMADAGVGTRTEVKEYIRRGRVSVNGEVIKKAEYKIDKDIDKVLFDDRALSFADFDYYMLNKPEGVVSAVTDLRDKTVIDLIKEERKKGLFPIGRLDKDTVGLLIITNDGPLEHKLLSPKKHVDKTYFAKVSGKVTEKEIEIFSEGLKVDEEFTALPAKLEVLAYAEADEAERNVNGDGAAFHGISEVEITIHEGKFHQIKRMFAAVGMEVIYLKRLSMGPIRLDEALAEGEYRRLTQEEVECLKM